MTMSDEKGGALIELIMVMALVILFGFTMFSLIIAGSSAQARIGAAKDAQIDARIAVSYLNVRLRQSGGRGAVSVRPDGGTNGQNALVIRNAGETADEDFDVWIFQDGGQLKEVLAAPGDEPFRDAANTIAPVKTFNVDKDGPRVSYSIEYEYNGKPETLSDTVYLRGEGGR